jgi:hypothetical protein
MNNILIVQKTFLGDISYREITEEGKKYLLDNEGKDNPHWGEEDLLRNYEELHQILDKKVD